LARTMPYADMDKMMSLSKRRGFMFQREAWLPPGTTARWASN